MQIRRFCLHREMTLATSEGPFLLHRTPLLSTTRTVLAPCDLMSANAWVCWGYQLWGWLTPRMMNSWPLASYRRPFLTWSPVAAFAGCVRAKTDASSARTVAAATARRFLMVFLIQDSAGRQGCTRVDYAAPLAFPS